MKSIFLIGPSGSGKTSLAYNFQNIYTSMFGKDSVILVNLDPANTAFAQGHIDINGLVSLEDVMQEYGLGPNASIIFAMQFLQKNIEWLIKEIKNKINCKKNQQASKILIFDLPGQIQLYINNECVKKTINAINKQLKTSPCVVELFDCNYMGNINDFMSLCMMSLCSLINLQLPHINLLNKVDMFKGSQNKPSKGLINEYFRLDAEDLIKNLGKTQTQKSITFELAVAKILNSFGHVAFMPCAQNNQDMIGNIIFQLQRAFGTLQISLLNDKFRTFTKGCGDLMAQERSMTEIENMLQEQQEQQNMKKYQKDIN